jgi:predicted nuclease with TOPRIM domain
MSKDNWMLITNNEYDKLLKDIKNIKKNQNELLKKIDKVLEENEDLKKKNNDILEFLKENRDLYIEKLENGEDKLNDMTKYFSFSYINRFHNYSLRSKNLHGDIIHDELTKEI